MDYVTKSEQKELFDLLLELHNFLDDEGMQKADKSCKKDKPKYIQWLDKNIIHLYLLLDFCNTNNYKALIYYIQKEDIKIENLNKSFKNTKSEDEKRKYVANLWNKISKQLLIILENKKYFEPVTNNNV